MPLFFRGKHGEITEQRPDLLDVGKVVSQEPQGVTVAKNRRYRCTLCSKVFVTSGVLSIHFMREHREHYQDKDSWRSFSEVISAEE